MNTRCLKELINDYRRVAVEEGGELNPGRLSLYQSAEQELTRLELQLTEWDKWSKMMKTEVRKPRLPQVALKLLSSLHTDLHSGYLANPSRRADQLRARYARGIEKLLTDLGVGTKEERSSFND